jgi:natural product precursor
MMKKLGKITINPEKVIKNEELINLKGGYDGYCCQCNNGQFMLLATNQSECDTFCSEAGYNGGVWVC